MSISLVLLPVVNFVRLRGLADPFEIDFTIEATGADFDLAGKTPVMFLNSAEDFSGTEIFGAAGKAGTISGSPVTNRLTVTPTGAEMNQVPADYYFVVIDDPTGAAPQGLATGRVNIKPSPLAP